MAVGPPSMPDLSRERPFDVHQVTTESGASPRVLDSLPGCQYRMTSYDVANDRSDVSPAYAIAGTRGGAEVGSPSQSDSGILVASYGT